MTIQENVALAPLTTLQVGGAARYFAAAQSEDDVRESLAFARTRQLPLFVLGGGSNLVVADSGWPGLVLKIAIGEGSRPHMREAGANSMIFSAGAGANWDDFVAFAISQNCAGVECLSGIPGSVGATPVQNVGAYGQEVAETIESVRAFDTKFASDLNKLGTDLNNEDRIVTLSRTECRFRYRSSIFNREPQSPDGGERGRYIILQVEYRLRRGGTANLKYADLRSHFADAPAQPSLAQVRDAVLEIRRRKGMVIVPGDADSRSVGSFFKNPILSEAQFRDLATRTASRGLTIPSYPALHAQQKVSAAWLVEHSGFGKGFLLGHAAISSKHALALINPGNAQAADILALKDTIQRGVEDTWGIRLEPEPVFVGF